MPWAMLTTTQTVPSIAAAALEARSAEAVLVDVREPDEYVAGHVPGAVNVPQADLASRLDELPPERQTRPGGRPANPSRPPMALGPKARPHRASPNPNGRTPA
jgi:rhodanese-related sulfurtransferase